MLGNGNGPTIELNGRFFIIFFLCFFKDQGYKVNEAKLEELLQKVLQDYKGQGWYTDSPFYDYYSMWAFQMFGGLWSDMFGVKQYPQYAVQFMQNLRDLAATYPSMFDAQGKMIMYGRSIAYQIGRASCRER